MKVSIKKIKSHEVKEWLILIDKKAIGITFTKDDAKFLAKCIKKYNKYRS